MPRDIVLGNGQLLINLDGYLTIRDIYYPYVGQFNHVGGHRCRIGVWTNDFGFAWLGGVAWDWEPGYRNGALVAESRATHRGLQLVLHMTHAVHPCHNLLLQAVRVENLATHDREVRLFFGWDLRIAESDIGDTAFYNPFLHSLMHYKRDFYFLISGYVGDSGEVETSGIHQYACGIKDFGGAEGAWRDAEDGHLSGNPIAQGSVDSIIGFKLPVRSRGSTPMRLWLTVGSTYKQTASTHKSVIDIGFDHLVADADEVTRGWGKSKVHGLDSLPERVASLYSRSLQVIRTHIDNHGAIVASTDSDIMQTARAHYAYMWPRDGALVAYAMDRAGFPEATAQFFEFCADALTESEARAGTLGGAALMHKYCPDGAFGATWHAWIADGKPEAPIQEDGTALVLWATGQRLRHHPSRAWAADIYERLVQPGAEFLVAHRDRETSLPLPSWDLWEERRGVHLYTTGTIVAALREAAYVAGVVGNSADASRYNECAEKTVAAMVKHFWSEENGRFLRTLYRDEHGNWYRDYVIDSSVCGAFAFGALPATDPKVMSTIQAVRDRLWVKTGIGGFARYEADYYFRVSEDFHAIPGNPWIICTLWLAEHSIAAAQTLSDLEPALEILEWTTLCASPTGILPEQIHPVTFQALSVSPLTWSHAQFVTTVVHYLERLGELQGEA